VLTVLIIIIFLSKVTSGMSFWFIL